MRLPALLALILISTLLILQTAQSQEGKEHFGVIDDSYEVNAAGAYNHLVPIHVPPGVNGLAPNLAVVYDSRSGVSDLGIGWALTGVSKISRGGNNFAQHGRASGIEFSTKDSFFLDGQYLSCYRGCNYGREQLGADDALYRTESETFAVIRSEGSAVNSTASPRSFVVKLSSGLTQYYGETEASRREVTLPGNRREVLDWHVSKIEDTFGNYIQFDYKRKPDNSIRISSIKYTGNRRASVSPKSRIIFEYVDEATLPPNTNLAFIAGVPVESNNRLSRIAVHTEERDFKYYHFKYDASMLRLREIKESTDAQGLFSLRPTEIKWETYGFMTYRDPLFIAAPKAPSASTQQPAGEAYFDERRLDLDNDGVDEVVIFRGNLREQKYWDSTYEVYKLDGNQHHLVAQGEYDSQAEVSPQVAASRAGQSLKNILEADINGDSLPDFISDNYSLINISSAKIEFRREKNEVADKAEIVGLARAADKRIALDLDGDNKDEIFVAGKDFNGHQFFSADGSTFARMGEKFDLKYRRAEVSDLNGDALADLVFITDGKIHFTARHQAKLLAEREYPARGFSKDDLDYLRFVDINGDGPADMVLVKPKTNLKVWLNDGGKFLDDPRELNVSFEPGKSLLSFGNFTNTGYAQLLFAEVADKTRAGAEEVKLWDLITTREATRLAPAKIQLSIPAQLAGRVHALLGDGLLEFRDLNYDGVLELLERTPAANPPGKGKGVEIFSPTKAVPDKVVSVTDGFGNAVEVEYTGLKDPETYRVTTSPLSANYRHTWGTYPLVKSIKYSNGKTDFKESEDELNTVKYAYTDLITETTGRGLSGFRGVSRTEERTGARTETEYQYEFPLSGKILSETRVSGKGAVLFRQVNTWRVKIYQGLGEEVDTRISEADDRRAARELGVDASRQKSLTESERRLLRTLARLRPHLSVDALEQENPGLKSGLKIDNPNSILKAVARFNRARLTYLPILVSSTVNKREIDGGLVSTSSMAFSYDNFGNVTKTETAFGDRSRLVVEKEFLNINRDLSDDAAYIIGLVSAEKTYGVSSAGAQTQARRVQHEFDAGTGALTKKVRQKADPRYELTTEVAYDLFGNVTRKKIYRDQANSLEESFSYSRDGRFRESYVNPLGQTTTYVHEPRYGNLTRERDPNNLEVRYEYDDFGQLAKTTYPDKRTVTYAFDFLEDENSNALYELRTNQSGAPELRQMYDKLGRAVSSSHALLDSAYKETGEHAGTDGRVQVYDKLSVERRVTRLNSYDAQGNLYMAFKPRYVHYISWREQISRRGEQTSILRKCAEPEEPLIPEAPEAAREGGGDPQQIVRLPGDISMSIAHLKRSNLGAAVFTYDELGRPVRSVFPGGKVITTEYTANRKVETDDQKRGTTTVYNRRGEVSEVIDSQHRKITYDYDLWGNVVSIDNPDGTAVKTSYDLLGRKTKTEDPAVGVVEYEYDGFDRMVKETTNGKKIVALSYDQLGRVTRRATAEGEVTWVYDGQIKGKVSQITDAHGNIRLFQYDGLARPISETHVLNRKEYRVAYAYDELSRLKSKTFFPSGYAIEFEYVNNIPVSVFEVKGGAKKFIARIDGIGPEGQVTSKAYRNGLSTTYRYDFNNDLLKSIETGKGAPPVSPPLIKECRTEDERPAEEASELPPTDSNIQALRYEYDAGYNLIKKIDLRNRKTEEYSYDPLDRLDRATTLDERGVRVTELEYNPSGNILSKSDKGKYEYSDPTSKHRVTYITKADKLIHSFKYDDFGNMVEDVANGLKVAYTSFNKPAQISKGTQVRHAVYGAENEEIGATLTSDAAPGRVILKPFPDYEVVNEGGAEVTLHYVFLGGELIAVHNETSGGAERKEFNHYVHKDHRGSIHLLTDDDGAKVAEYDYDSFGGRSFDATVTSRRGFTSHEHLDEFGLINASGRYYMPGIGRFISADPLIQAPSNLQSLNRYSYVLNNPQNLVDPSGFSWLSRGVKNVRRELGKGVRNVGRAVGTAGQQTSGVHRNIYNEGDRFADKYGKQIVIITAAAAITVASGGSLSGLVAPMAYGALTSVAINAAVISYHGGNFQDILNTSMSAAVNGAASGAAFFAVGEGFRASGLNTSFGSTGYLGKVGTHAVVGGITSEASGGDFKNGMISASITQAFSPLIQHQSLLGADPDNAFYRVAFAGSIGGLAAYASGGNIVMGATTATFSRWFNDERHLTSASRSIASSKMFLKGPGIGNAFTLIEATENLSSGNYFKMSQGVAGFASVTTGTVGLAIPVWGYVSVGLTVYTMLDFTGLPSSHDGLHPGMKH